MINILVGNSNKEITFRNDKRKIDLVIGVRMKNFKKEVVIAVYDTNGKLVGLNSADINADYAEISVNYVDTAASVKVFVWDGFTACVPLVNAKTLTIQ